MLLEILKGQNAALRHQKNENLDNFQQEREILIRISCRRENGYINNLKNTVLLGAF